LINKLKASGAGQMPKTVKSANYYDLEDRTLKFAKDARQFIKQIPKTISNIEDAKQLNNVSGSVGANYIEANQAISKKNFIHLPWRRDGQNPLREILPRREIISRNMMEDKGNIKILPLTYFLLFYRGLLK